MRSTTALTVALLLMLCAVGTAYGRSDDGVAPSPARAVVGTHDLCGATINVTNNGRFFTDFVSDPDVPFHLAAGLWVGAYADRGQGSEVSVSTGLYELEYFPPDDPPGRRERDNDLDAGRLQVLYQDVFTPEWLPDHRPLGIEVGQESVPMQVIGGGVSYIDVNFSIKNISDEYASPGWDLENVYVGLLLDPDVGRTDAGPIWVDDLGGFEPVPRPVQVAAPGTERGDLAYLYDAPGGGDDVDTQVGVVLRNLRTHVFRIWSGGDEDPRNDSDRYALLRGESDEGQTIDPPPSRPADYRLLISAGPLPSIPPGRSQSFAVSLVCGELVPPGAVPALPLRQTARGPDLVVSRRQSGVRFAERDGDVEVFSVTGRRVAAVPASAGWDLRSADGGRAPAGVYFYRFSGQPGVHGKIVVTR